MNTRSHLFFNFAFFGRTGEVLIFSRLPPCTNLESEISLMKVAILILAAVSRVNKVVTTCELCLPRNINHLCGSHTQWIIFVETNLDCFNVLPSNSTNKSHWKMHSSRLSTWNWKSKRKIRLKSQMKKILYWVWMRWLWAFCEGRVDTVAISVSRITSSLNFFQL